MDEFMRHSVVMDLLNRLKQVRGLTLLNSAPKVVWYRAGGTNNILNFNLCWLTTIFEYGFRLATNTNMVLNEAI